jgi:hypothetical protein
MTLRDKIITGSFMIGHDGQKEPISWLDYALKLEKYIQELEANVEKEKRELWDRACEAQRRMCAEDLDGYIGDFPEDLVIETPKPEYQTK